MAIKADFATEDDKKWLADSLFYLEVPSTGNKDDDVRKLSALIDKYVLQLRIATLVFISYSSD